MWSAFQTGVDRNSPRRIKIVALSRTLVSDMWLLSKKRLITSGMCLLVFYLNILSVRLDGARPEYREHCCCFRVRNWNRNVLGFSQYPRLKFKTFVNSVEKSRTQDVNKSSKAYNLIERDHLKNVPAKHQVMLIEQSFVSGSVWKLQRDGIWKK